MIALPYGRHTITEADIEAVATVLRSDWLTTGPKVAEFERALAEFVGVRHAVVVNSGTAALHCAMAAIGTSPGDEVIVPSISFVATANCVVYCRATPVFADVAADTALIDPADVERKITSRTKAIMAMDYGGQPADYEALRAIIARTGRRIWLVADPPWRSTSVNLKRAINHRCSGTILIHPRNLCVLCVLGASSFSFSEISTPNKIVPLRQHKEASRDRQRLF